MCAGATVYAPLRVHVKPWSKVGILGLGGLGHIAVQFARAFGCEVTVFSTSADKEAEARKFGATKFVVTTDAAQVAAAKESVDLILNTATVTQDLDTVVSFLRKFGVLVLLGIPTGKFEFSAKSLLFNQLTVTTSLIASPAVMQEMLDFAARHQISCQIESMTLDQVNSALDRVRTNKARYRIVLHNN